MADVLSLKVGNPEQKQASSYAVGMQITKIRVMGYCFGGQFISPFLGHPNTPMSAGITAYTSWHPSLRTDFNNHDLRTEKRHYA